jgi:kumamolisin
MPANGPRVALEGSVRTGLPEAVDIGPVPADERVELTIRLRLAQPAAHAAALAAVAASASAPGSAPPLTPTEAAGQTDGRLSRDQLRDVASASPDDAGRVAAFAREFELDVLDVRLAERRVVVAGSAGAVARAFGVGLRRYRLGTTTFRGRIGPLTIPADLEAIIEGVFGLDDRPQAAAHFRVLEGEPNHPAVSGPPGLARPALTRGQSYSPPQVASLYDFVSDADGRGQAIALIELGGGFRPADLATWFKGIGVALPSVSAVEVDGGRNAPGSPDGADGEVMLDIEVAGSIAPGARIVVYFAPNTDRGFLDAISQAVHDPTHKPSVISISWGGPESAWTSQAMTAMDQVFADAALIGLTITCASGDNGSDDRVGDGRAHADFPASSPHVLACGGTRISGTTTALSAEVAWNDGPAGGSSGGGISDVFGMPAWQAGAKIPASANPGGRIGRGLPDVAGDASPASGYAVRVDGNDLVFGGTSAVAPLYAALVALINQRLGHSIGFLNPVLYGDALGAIEDITEGDNGAYPAGSGWDACTGLGRIDGMKLLRALEWD